MVYKDRFKCVKIKKQLNNKNKRTIAYVILICSESEFKIDCFVFLDF